MAIENEQFSRKDLFTFFVSARIINFLKLLARGSSDQTLSELMSNEGDDWRQDLGRELFGKLLNEQKLYGGIRGQLFEVESFEFEVFRQIWSSLEYIGSVSGAHILCDRKLS